ncbi:hypothetical protein C8J57DRAFT_1543240 [Mycena rebaudengoi]|nr:hypothetical protein C8J57DRAFT_1543240 [Mycena rebaudengoi]
MNLQYVLFCVLVSVRGPSNPGCFSLHDFAGPPVRMRFADRFPCLPLTLIVFASLCRNTLRTRRAGRPNSRIRSHTLWGTSAFVDGGAILRWAFFLFLVYKGDIELRACSYAEIAVVEFDKVHISGNAGVAYGQWASTLGQFSAHVPPTLFLNGRDEPPVTFNYRAPGALSRALQGSSSERSARLSLTDAHAHLSRKTCLRVVIELFVPFLRTSSPTRNSHSCLSSSHAWLCPPFSHMHALHPTELTLVLVFLAQGHSPFTHAPRPTSEFFASQNGSAFVPADTGAAPAGGGGARGAVFAESANADSSRCASFWSCSHARY